MYRTSVSEYTSPVFCHISKIFTYFFRGFNGAESVWLCYLYKASILKASEHLPPSTPLPNWLGRLMQSTAELTFHLSASPSSLGVCVLLPQSQSWCQLQCWECKPASLSDPFVVPVIWNNNFWLCISSLRINNRTSCFYILLYNLASKNAFAKQVYFKEEAHYNTISLSKCMGYYHSLKRHCLKKKKTELFLLFFYFFLLFR